MSRVAKEPLPLPAGVEFKQADDQLTIKGPKGVLTMTLAGAVAVDINDGVVQVSAANDEARAQAGTVRALLGNMVSGVTQGFERRLQLVGVGYRAQAQGKSLNLTLGYSHPVEFKVPEGITIETPSQTEIVVRGIDKQQVGQTASEIRAFRPPEPYKGKGVRYADERISLKEAKKA